MMTAEKRGELISLYGNAHELLIHALKEFPREMWQFKPEPEKWSIHEIIIHITDSEINSYSRCRCFIAEPGKTIMAYDQDQWAISLKYHQQSTGDALELFKFLRQASYNLISSLPEETWNNQIFHPENGIMKMDDWLQMYADHIPIHIRQMQRVYEAWKIAGPLMFR